MEKSRKCIKKFIKSCDAFGTFITFRINDDLEYKSIIGGLSTIFFVLVTLAYIIYCCIGFFGRSNVNLIYTSKVVDKSPFVNLTESKFSMAFGIQFSDPNKEKESPAINELKEYFDFSISQIEWVGENSIDTQTYQYRRCETSDFFNKVNESFDTNGLRNLFCPIFEKSSNFSVEGSYTDDFYKYIKIEILLTDKALEIIKNQNNILMNQELEMAIFWLDSAIDYESRTNPIPSYINYSYKTIDYKFLKKTDLYISSLEFEIDDNIIWNNKQKHFDAILDVSVDSFKHIPERNISQNKDDNKIGQFVIQASSKVIQVSRSYQKFPSFLADLTSLLEEILVLLLIIVNFVERKAVDHKLIEKMLKFRGSKYFDVGHLIDVFNKDKINNNIMNIIGKQTLNIERKNNIVSKRQSVMILLNKDHLRENTEKDNNLRNLSIIEESYHTPKNNHDKVSEKITLTNKNNNESEDDSPQSRKIYNTSQEGQKIGSTNRYETDELNKNIQIHSSCLSSKKNSVYYKQEEMLEIQNTKQDSNQSIDQNYIEFEYPNLNIFDIIWATLCFWSSKKQKRRSKIIDIAEKKIHYYLDIYTYITKMQEIDIMKYCLFDEDQLTLIKFLSKPPVKLGYTPFGVYSEFENQQKSNHLIGKKEINELFSTYINVRNKDEITFEDLKLLRLVKAEVDFFKS